MAELSGDLVNWLPHGTVLGELVEDEVFVFYDGPRLFSCRSRTDQTYLATWAASEANEDLWLYVPVSMRRLAVVRSGGLPLRQAFTRPEGPVYLVRIRAREDAVDTADVIESNALSDEWLAADEFHLNLPTATATPAISLDGVWRLAQQESRTRLRLELELPTYSRTEAPSRRVGELLVLTQNVLDNIGLSVMMGDPPQRGKIPADVAAAMASEIVGLAAASFVIDLAAHRFDDLFGESPFADAAERLLNLLDTSLASEQLVTQLEELRPRGAKSFRNFVRGLAATGAGVKLAAAGSRLTPVERDLPAERLSALDAILNNLVPDDVTEIRGRMRLYRVDADRKQFGLRDEMTGERYEGKVSERALVQVAHATMMDFYDVLVASFPVFDEAVGERKPRYILEQLNTTAEQRPAESVVVWPEPDLER